MPCRCDDYETTPKRGVYYDDTAMKERKAIKNTLDEVTQNLCYLCGMIITDLKREDMLKKNKRLYQWWRKHLAADEKRVRDEMRKMIPNLLDYNKSARYIADAFIEKARRVHAVSTFHVQWFYDLALEILQEFQSEVEKENRKQQLRVKALGKLSREEQVALGIQ